MKLLLKKLRDGFVRFSEKQGFPIIITLCVAVITATALWTRQPKPAYVSPTPPAADNVSAAQLLQQSLRSAATSTPIPSPAPKRWQAPLDAIEVLLNFTLDVMRRGDATGIWMIHDALDLKGQPGDQVYALSDGRVIAEGQDDLLNAWIKIDHGDNIEALYAGLALTGAYIEGDTVRAGDTIGFIGSGTLEESSLGPHLHLRVTKNGDAFDPSMLWNGD